MTQYVIVATTDIVAKELRRYIILTQQSHTKLRYTQSGNTFTVDVEWPDELATGWRNYITERFGV